MSSPSVWQQVPSGTTGTDGPRIEDRLLPLPHAHECRGWQAVRPGQLCVVAESDDAMVQLSAHELAEFLATGTGARVPVSKSRDAVPDDAFVLSLEQGDDPAVPVAGYQAYGIVPDDRGLRLIGREPIGTYYAVKTLKQAIAPLPWGVRMPQWVVSDYADLAERGFWDYFYPAPIRPTSEMHTLETPQRWFAFLDDLADYKINLLDLLIWDEGLYYNSARFPELVEPGTPANKNEIVREVIAYARQRGIRILLNLCHPEHFARLHTAHPELAGVNPTGQQQRLLDMLFCVSHPKTREIFAGIAEEVVDLFEPDGLLVWPPENLGRCTCEACTRHGYLRQFYSIYREARDRIHQTRPGLPVRLMVSYLHHYDTVLRMVPDDAELVYYECDRHGMYGFDNHKRLPAHLTAANRAGRRILGCMIFRGCGQKYVPLPYLETVAEWVRLLVRDGYYGLDGSVYSNPGTNRLNILRMADVAWNAAGRETEAYLRAYGTCHAQAQPGARAGVLHALSDGWEQYHRRWGGMMEGGALDWLLAPREWGAVDARITSDALEQHHLPAMWAALVNLQAAADRTRQLGDERLEREVRVCQIRLGAMYHILAAVRLRDPDPWRDPQTGRCTHWVAAMREHLAAARDLLVELPEVTGAIVSSWAHVEGDPTVSDEKCLAKLDEALAPARLDALARAHPIDDAGTAIADGSQDPQP